MRDSYRLVGILAVLWALTACGGASPLAGLRTARLPSPELLAGGAKVAAGVPEGISVTWTRIASPQCQGYFLYRYTEADRPPEPDPESNPPFPINLRVNGGERIPQPAEGQTVTFSDYFPAVIGETYYYRVTAVDDQVPPQESYPSAERGWTVHGHTVSGLNPTAAYWGDDVTVSGDTFGDYDEGADTVRFNGLGGELDGEIVSWTDTEIVATIPDYALTGPVKVVIAGGFAETDEDLVILQPTILGIDPDVCFVEWDLSIIGVNFGAEQGASTVFIGERDVSAAVTSWTDSKIVLVVPVDIAAGDLQVTVNGRASNRVPFIPCPEMLSLDPPSAQPGEIVVIQGRHFGAEQGRVLLDKEAELQVIYWAQDQVHAELAGEIGPHTLAIETSQRHWSNIKPYTLVPRLVVSFSGLDEGHLYRAGDEPVLVVTAPEDTERVELLVDDKVMGQPALLPPFDGLELDITALLNGNHTVQLRAHRRAIETQSEIVRITVYSLVGDVNADGVVDFADRDMLAALAGLTLPDYLMLPWYDTDEDGAITEADLSAIGYHWQESISP